MTSPIDGGYGLCELRSDLVGLLLSGLLLMGLALDPLEPPGLASMGTSGVRLAPICPKSDTISGCDVKLLRRARVEGGVRGDGVGVLAKSASLIDWKEKETVSPLCGILEGSGLRLRMKKISFAFRKLSL